MLHVFLVILKIIGIILLVLVGIITVLAFVLMFVPVCYRINGKVYEVEDGEEYKQMYETSGKISFLGFIFRADYEYKEQLKWKVKVCGITIMSDESSGIDEENEFDAGFDDFEIDDKTDENELKNDITTEEKSLKEDKTKDKIRNKKSKRKSKKSKNIGSKISGFFEKIKKALADFKNTLLKIKNAFVEFKKLLENERFKQSYRFIVAKIKFVLKKIAPHIKYAVFEFGTKDPALTGELTGVACAIRGMSGINLEFVPDFDTDRTYIHADLKMKGKIRIFHFVKLAYYYFFSQEVKYFKHMIMKTRRNL